MKTTLIKFSKRKSYFNALQDEWGNLFQGAREIDALFEPEPSPKKKRALELSASFSSNGAGSCGGGAAGERMDTMVKSVEKDIVQSAFTKQESKRSKTAPSNVERVNEWYQEVLKHGASGSLGLVPLPWQRNFSAHTQYLKGNTLDIVEHYALWREKH